MMKVPILLNQKAMQKNVHLLLKQLKITPVLYITKNHLIYMVEPKQSSHDVYPISAKNRPLRGNFKHLSIVKLADGQSLFHPTVRSLSPIISKLNEVEAVYCLADSQVEENIAMFTYAKKLYPTPSSHTRKSTI